MRREYRVIIPVAFVVAAFLALVVEKGAFFTLLLGGAMSSASCVLSMKAATYANVRTADAARRSKSIGEAKQMALIGGSVCGLSTHAFGLLGFAVVALLNWQGLLNPDNNGSGLLAVIVSTLCNPATIRLTTYSLGCSLVAMFNRVAGGNYTKAADISADIVAKNRHDLPEDDSRMPNTVADFIGDNVNDVAGNGSDLLESFVATLASSVLVASMAFRGSAVLEATIVFPIILAAGGLLGCVVGILYASAQSVSVNPARELNMITYIAAAVAVAAGVAGAYFLFGTATALPETFRLGWMSPLIASVFGIVSGSIIIGRATEYYTSSDYNPVKILARFAKEGEAFVVTKGDAVGSRSCLIPCATIAVSIVIAGSVCGVYGIAVAALGMLSFVGATVTVDAFGPIADNAGGMAESCHLGEDVRAITDRLDALGNTTAAIGKGMAIGSAAFATISLMVSYVGSYMQTAEPVLNIIGFSAIAGAILGGALVEYFSAILTDNTINSAYLMAEEGDRQLSIPGVLEGRVKPDYDRVIEMAATEALKKMLLPSVLALVVPMASGVIFGPEFVGGLLVGATIVAIPRAIFMGNSGGAFDNAKKYIECGGVEGVGKGSLAHKAAVAGDTVGDTRKDVVGVALDIFIKMMSTVANTMAPIFCSARIF